MNRLTRTSMSRSIVIVGVGAVTALGPSATALWVRARAGEVGFGPVRGLSMSGYRTVIGGEVVGVPRPQGDRPWPDRGGDRVYGLALAAVEEAVAQAGITTDEVPAGRWAVVMGRCNGGLLSLERYVCGPDRATGARMPPLVPPQALAETVGGFIGARGPVLSLDTACASGANAVGWAADLVRHGRAEVAVAGGADTLSGVAYAGFRSLEALGPEPAAPCSEGREGLSFGEGVGVLVLTTEEVARRCGAPVLAEVVGYGLSADGYQPMAPDPTGGGPAWAVASMTTDHDRPVGR
jgi:3-oxoacyl-[acyl-carrier-protein] synthase II